MDIHIAALILINWSSLATGLRCWACDNAASEDECIRNGKPQQCGAYHKMSCQTEVRFHEGWGGGARIRTGCKEYHACRDNQSQNPRTASKVTQCNPKRTNSVCRCCCKRNICNKRNLLCRQENLQHSFNIIPPSKTPERGNPNVADRGRRPVRGNSPDMTSEIAPSNITVFIRYPVLARRVPLLCNDLRPLKHGKTTCNRLRKRVGTTCRFQCLNRNHALNPKIALKCVKINDKAVWSHDKPQCLSQASQAPPRQDLSGKCPPAGKKDIAIMMDSSLSVSLSEWQTMKTFVFNLIRGFDMSNDSMQFAVVRYNRVVDFKTQILFDDHTNDGEALRLAIEQMPKRGFGKRLGKALRDVKDRVLTMHNRREAPDMVLVITGGKTQDMRLLRKVSKEMRRGGVEILALGLPDPQEKGLLRQLLAMTGKRNRVVVARNAIAGFPKTLIDRITRFIC